MKCIPAAICAAYLSLALPAAAQVAVNQAQVERDATILADDNMEGRQAGTPGHQRAADYVAGRMADMGLQPAGEDGTYFQTVRVRRHARSETGNELAIDGFGKMTSPRDYVVSGNPQQESGTIEAPLVFIGYGLDIPGRDDFAGVDLEGAIAVYVYGGPQGLDPELADYLASSLDARLSERGAIGRLLIHSPMLEAQASWRRLAAIRSRSGGTTWIAPDGSADSVGPNIAVNVAVSPALGRALLAGHEFDYDDLVAAEATDRAIMPSFALNRTATITYSSTFADFETPNVIGMIPGSDPALADEFVLLTAHLDHVGTRPTEQVGDDEIYNGALDNAVGVASMLEVSRLLLETPPRRPVLVLALTAEEMGLIGSSYNAAHPTVPAAQMVANVNLDMPITTYDFSDVVAFGAERSTLFPAVTAAVSQYGLKLSPDPQPEQSFFTRSDQYSYVLAGIPAVYLDLGFGNGGERAQGIVLNEHYHEPSDEISLVDFDALGRFTGVNYLIARNVANMEQRPAWLPGDFFGTTYGGTMLEAD